MSLQSITKKYIEVAPNEKGVTHLKVETYYNKGGMNYFANVNESRGIYLSVSPVTRKLNEGIYWSESFTAFSGIKTQVLEMARYNKKKCESFVLDIELEKKLINHTTNKNNLTINLVV